MGERIAPRDTLAPGVDIASLERWLTDVAGFVPPVQLKRIGLGQSNLTYLASDAAGGRAVVRRPPLGELARGAHDMTREHRILSALADQPVPTPRPLAFSPESGLAGAPVYAMEYVDGLVLHTNAAAAELPDVARARVGGETVAGLAALHAVDVNAVGLGDLARHDGYADRQLRGWLRQWESTRTRELPVIERTAAILARSIPVQRELAIVHGDYNLANLIVTPHGELEAVLDWELSTLGDPVADLGTLLCYWPDRPEQTIPDRDAVTLLPGFVRRAKLVEGYAEAAPDRDLSGLPFWLALATWKLAIIFEGVTRRRLQNEGNSLTSPDTLRRTTEHLAELAAELVG